MRLACGAQRFGHCTRANIYIMYDHACEHNAITEALGARIHYAAAAAGGRLQKPCTPGLLRNNASDTCARARARNEMEATTTATIDSKLAAAIFHAN